MTNQIIIPDVSFYQDSNETPQGIDFQKMRSLCPAVIIRAGQNIWKDPDIVYNWRESKKAGLLRGSYWFYDSRINPKRQAELYIQTLDGDLGELPLWCDFEDRYNGQYKGWKYFYNFIENLKILAPNKQIGIYTAYYYWLEHTTQMGISNAEMQYFKQYPLWVANYNVDKPLVPKPFDTWALWQYTDNGDGKLYGVESKNIDLNYFNGTMDDFKRLFQIEKMPEIEKPNIPEIKREVITLELQGNDLTIKTTRKVTIKDK